LSRWSLANITSDNPSRNKNNSTQAEILKRRVIPITTPFNKKNSI
jgi:hypothetical protein